MEIKNQIVKNYCALGFDYLHITDYANFWIENIFNQIPDAKIHFFYDDYHEGYFMNLEIQEKGEFKELLRPFYIKENCLYSL